MDMQARKEQYHSQVDTLQAVRPALRRKWKGDAAKQKAIEEYVALCEEVAARSYDHDRATQKAKFCDPDDPKGAMQLKGYQDMAASMAKRLEEIAPRLVELKEELGA